MWSVIHITQTSPDQYIQEVSMEVIMETVAGTTTTDTLTITITVTAVEITTVIELQ